MEAEAFIYDSPLKEQILRLTEDLAQVEARLRPIEENYTNLQNRLGCLFILFEVGSLFSWPGGRALIDLSNQRESLKNRIKALKQEAFKTITPNQRRASELDWETTKAVVRELRARHGQYELSSISAREFEDLVARLFKCLGWAVQQTPYSQDGGKDAILQRGDEIVYLECKHFISGGVVGRPHLQKLKGAMVDANATSGIVVTSSSVSEPGKDYAKRHGISLLTGKELRDMLLAHKLIHLASGMETYVIHCSNCLCPQMFNFSFEAETRRCSCGNAVDTGLIVLLGTNKIHLPAFD